VSRKLPFALLVGVLVATVLVVPSPVSRPAPVSALTTIFYNGAGRSAPHIAREHADGDASLGRAVG
jgi:hypothetical protein